MSAPKLCPSSGSKQPSGLLSLGKHAFFPCSPSISTRVYYLDSVDENKGIMVISVKNFKKKNFF